MSASKRPSSAQVSQAWLSMARVNGPGECTLRGWLSPEKPNKAKRNHFSCRNQGSTADFHRADVRAGTAEWQAHVRALVHRGGLWLELRREVRVRRHRSHIPRGLLEGVHAHHAAARLELGVGREQ